jgi:hypothetical protein
MKTVLFLATALCGEEFAMEYVKLVFFDKPTPDGHGIGIFRRSFGKHKKAKGTLAANTTEEVAASGEETEAIDGVDDASKASYQIGLQIQ